MIFIVVEGLETFLMATEKLKGCQFDNYSITHLLKRSYIESVKTITGSICASLTHVRRQSGIPELSVIVAHIRVYFRFSLVDHKSLAVAMLTSRGASHISAHLAAFF